MYCNRNNQLKQRKERQIKNEQSSNTNKLILFFCFPAQKIWSLLTQPGDDENAFK